MASDTRLEDLVSAAKAVLHARTLDGITDEAWDVLARATLAGDEAPGSHASAGFAFMGDLLVRSSTLASGQHIDHPFGVDAVEYVANAIERADGGAFVVETIAADADVPWMTAYVVVEFLKRCGLVHVDGGYHHFVAADGFAREQAVAEFTVAQIKAREA